MTIVKFLVAHGRAACKTCGIRFGVTVELSESNTPTLTTSPNSGDGRCTDCVAHGHVLAEGAKMRGYTGRVRERACAECGKPYEYVNSRKIRCVPCQKSVARKRSASPKNKIPVDRICKYTQCAAPFQTINLNTLTCSPACGVARRQEREAKRYARKRAETAQLRSATL